MEKRFLYRKDGSKFWMVGEYPKAEAEQRGLQLLKDGETDECVVIPFKYTLGNTVIEQKDIDDFYRR